MSDGYPVIPYAPENRPRYAATAALPFLGLAMAVLSLIMVQYIWMIGCFASADADHPATRVVLVCGAAVAFAGGVVGFILYGRRVETGRRHASR